MYLSPNLSTIVGDPTPVWQVMRLDWCSVALKRPGVGRIEQMKWPIDKVCAPQIRRFDVLVKNSTVFNLTLPSAAPQQFRVQLGLSPRLGRRPVQHMIYYG
mmetsp:Transcript_1598/g.2612  ORF Transcript_1598/g.2612 Transcript_1598/m.2612 type:complete len:101 (-) Transcript_1598:328-630(-)